MKGMKCPSCKKMIDMSTEICPHCNELIFYDVIVSEEIKEDKENKIDKIKSAISKRIDKNRTKDNTDDNKNTISVKIRIISKLKCILSWFNKKFSFIGEKLKKSKIYPYITYQNVLCVITVFATVAMVAMGIKIAKFTDRTSVVSKVNDETTYQEVEHLQKKEKVEKRLDLQRGLIIMIYKNQEYAGIKSTVIYEVVPSTDKINQTIIKFPYKKKDVDSMRKYLEVNYGYGKEQEDGTLSYANDEFRYNFTNGISNEEGNSGEEVVEIVPLKDE